MAGVQTNNSHVINADTKSMLPHMDFMGVFNQIKNAFMSLFGAINLPHFDIRYFEIGGLLLLILIIFFIYWNFIR